MCLVSLKFHRVFTHKAEVPPNARMRGASQIIGSDLENNLGKAQPKLYVSVCPPHVNGSISKSFRI